MSRAFWDGRWTPKFLAAEAVAAIPAAEVKTASAVGNGRLVQVRVTWTDSSKRRRVGTFSMPAKVVRQTYGFRPTEQAFVASVFGMASKAAMHEAPRSLVKDAVALALASVASSGRTRDALDELIEAAGDAMAAVAAGDGPERVARAKRLARAQEGLRSWLSEALRAGIKDAELKKIMREEMVRLVHEA